MVVCRQCNETAGFRFETHDTPIYQPAVVVNYPNDYPYARVTEFKYLTGQKHDKTTTVTEYPRAEGDPYYPVPRPENTELYKRYKRLADATPHTHFVGCLATYKYYNMDQVVGQALALYDKIEKGESRDRYSDGVMDNESVVVGTLNVNGCKPAGIDVYDPVNG